MDKEDLIQEAARAWSEAASRLDPANGAQFRGYALPFIRRALLDYAFANQRIVSPPKSRRVQSVILAIRSATKGKMITKADKSEISEKYGMPISEVDAWHSYLVGGDVDCFELIGGEIPVTPSMLELLAWSEEEAVLAACAEGVNRLSAREQSVIKMRYLSSNTKTLELAGIEMGVSVSRVWQIEQQAITKLKTMVDNLPSMKQIA
jgi:RNA polymerase sigma factor (sigma-70 family)